MKTRDDIFKKISGMIHEMFKIPLEEIKYESQFYEDLNLDSIDAIDLITEFQSEIGKRVAPDEFNNVRKVGDVVEVIERLLFSSKNESVVLAD